MKILLRQAKIYQKSGPYHLEKKDILIENGVITSIENQINVSADKVYESNALCVSIGWFDPYVEVGDPGYEENETLETVSKAARKGGFTAIGVLPNSFPVADSKSQIEYLVNRAKFLPIDIYPIGALSEGLKGDNITEYFDMQNSGAIAFSDGQKGITNANLIKKALLYNKPFNGKVMAFCEDESIAANGMVNESPNTMSLGLKFRPALAEEIQIQRNLQLVAYTEGRMHFSCVSTSNGVEMIKEAKAKGLKVTADVSINNLSFTDEAVNGFDSHYKVLPTLKTETDRQALVKGLHEGVIDYITSNHQPKNVELKKVAFDHADFGISGLETFFANINNVPGIDLEKVIDTITYNSRSVFGLEIPSIEVNRKANITLFDPTIEASFTTNDWQSKSKNSPMINVNKKGIVLDVIH